MNTEDLYSREGWLRFTYPDGSSRVVRTTLNEEILKHAKNRPDGNVLYDLDRMRWIRIPESEEVVLTVHEERPSLSEVDNFVSRFI